MEELDHSGVIDYPHHVDSGSGKKIRPQLILAGNSNWNFAHSVWNEFWFAYICHPSVTTAIPHIAKDTSRGTFKKFENFFRKFWKFFEKSEIFEKNQPCLNSIFGMRAETFWMFFNADLKYRCWTVLLAKKFDGMATWGRAIKRKRRLWFLGFTLLSKNVELRKKFTFMITMK